MIKKAALVALLLVCATAGALYSTTKEPSPPKLAKADKAAPKHGVANGSSTGDGGAQSSGPQGGGPSGRAANDIFDMSGDRAPGAGNPQSAGGGKPGSKSDSSTDGAAGHTFASTAGGQGTPDLSMGGPGGGHGGEGGGGSFGGGGGGGGGGKGGTAPGNIQPADRPAITSPIPEPETYLMMLMGLGFVGVVSRRMKRSANR